MNPTTLRSTILVNINEQSPALLFNVYSNSAFLSAEARMWLADQVGPEALDIPTLVANPYYGYHFVGGKKGRGRYTFMFTDRTKAALFKLTWS
ncbi:hypothetical protein D3C86_1741180 [compost metagenome]